MGISVLVIFTSIFTMIPEDSALWTVIALFRTQDPESGENREVTCLDEKMHLLEFNLPPIITTGL